MKITKISIAISALAFIVAAINLIYSIIYKNDLVPVIIIFVVTIVILGLNIALQIATAKQEKLEAAEKAEVDGLIADEAKTEDK